MREIARAQKRNPLSDLGEILQDGRYRRRNQAGKFWWPSVKGFKGGGGVKFWPFPLTLIVVLTTLALPCECVIGTRCRKVSNGFCPGVGANVLPSNMHIKIEVPVPIIWWDPKFKNGLRDLHHAVWGRLLWVGTVLSMLDMCANFKDSKISRKTQNLKKTGVIWSS